MINLDELLKARVERKRIARTQEIADAVKLGQYCPAAMDVHHSWWPQRPTIKKDAKEVARVYGETPGGGEG